MLLHGYCTTCRKPALVNATPASLASGKAPMGICRRCQDIEDERRRKAREPRRLR